MTTSARIFTSGNSQAVRLPKSFRINASEVWIFRNEATGEIVLQPKPGENELETFFDLLEAAPKAAAQFIPPRDDSPTGNPLTDWETSAVPSPRRRRLARK